MSRTPRVYLWSLIIVLRNGWSNFLLRMDASALLSNLYTNLAQKLEIPQIFLILRIAKQSLHSSFLWSRISEQRGVSRSNFTMSLPAFLWSPSVSREHNRLYVQWYFRCRFQQAHFNNPACVLELPVYADHVIRASGISVVIVIL